MNCKGKLIIIGGAVDKGSFTEKEFDKDVAKNINFFEKGILMLGGSANLQHSGHYYFGDLSGINTSKIPLWFTPFFKPGDRISRIRDWDQKIEEIALQAKNWDIWVVSGIPSWVQLLFERIIQHHGVRTIHDIWPNLQVFAYGGVAMDPYLPAFERICARPLSYIETYLASEGFLAYDTRIAPERKGMRLSLNNGIYYEFIPFSFPEISIETRSQYSSFA